MSHLIIHTKTKLREDYLLNFLNQKLKENYKSIKEIKKIPDFYLIKKDTTESIGIEDIKKMQKAMIYHPLNLNYQVGIMFTASNLTTEAQNALLKTLEEAPEHTLYILLVNNEQNLLPTIISRCQNHYINKQDEVHNSKTPQILEMELHERFKFIDNLIEQEKEEKGSIQNFLNELETFYRNNLENNKNSIEILKRIIQSKKYIKANVNAQLTLENLILRI